MTEKYEIENIGNMFRVLKDGEPLTTKFENADRMDVINLVEELNELHDKNKFLSDFRGFITMEHQKIKEENEQLKSELSRYKEVNRLDIWKSSYSSEDALITELQDKCDKKQEHIVILENKIRRMRGAIHKLEWLATHRNGELIRENEQLKSVVKEVIELLSEEVDVFSDKATEHDINAYIELKELDNKDAYYMATATKKAIQKLKELTR